MAQRWKSEVIDPIRDKIVALLVARRTSDGLEALNGAIEILNHLHADRSKFAARGIYVLSPRYRPQRDGETTEAYQFTLRFPVLCRSVAFTDAKHENQLDDLTGCVFDTVDANPGLDTLAVSSCWVDDMTEIEIEEGGGPEAYVAAQIVYVSVQWERDSTP